MKQLFNEVAFDCSKLVTQKYSTSFSIAVKMLPKDIRDAIYSIYGFVRFADEIVDTFHIHDKATLLTQFEKEYYEARKNKISLNPILHSFQATMDTFNIDENLVVAFLQSMKADLEKTIYHTETEIKQYIYGSAEVVGLMCLKVFVRGNQALYEKLTLAAMQLGSAFQKVNFLRDLKNDFSVLERSYFPNVELHNITQEQKNKITTAIHHEFEDAFVGIKQLPMDVRLGVFVAYKYYLKLFNKLKNTPSEKIMQVRIRVSTIEKAIVFLKSYIRYSTNFYL